MRNWHKLYEHFCQTVAKYRSLTFHASLCFIKQAASTVTETATESLDSGAKPLCCTVLYSSRKVFTLPVQMQNHHVRLLKPAVVLRYIHPVPQENPIIHHFKLICLKRKKEKKWQDLTSLRRIILFAKFCSMVGGCIWYITYICIYMYIYVCVF